MLRTIASSFIIIFSFHEHYSTWMLANDHSKMPVSVYRITGIIRGRKILQITFFAIVREKTFAIQAISYIKIPAEIKSAWKHSRMLPDLWNSQNFSSADNSHYTVVNVFQLLLKLSTNSLGYFPDTVSYASIFLGFLF